jgi:hypothetical protein
MSNSNHPSFRDAPKGAGPESITTARLAPGPFAQSQGAKHASFGFANAASRKRGVSMDSGLALRAPRNDEFLSLR